MTTLKQLIVTIVMVLAIVTAFSQDYNAIEFVENKGQWDSKVKFRGEVAAGSIFIRDGGFTIVKHNAADFARIQEFIHHPSGDLTSPGNSIVVRSHAWDVDFIDASPEMQIVPEKMLTNYENYFIGNDPSKWAGECRIYQALTFKNVYPNVDVRYYTHNGVLKYDIIAKPGADISKIALKYKGVNKLQVKNKELVIETSLGQFRESYPYSYQSGLKERKVVDCKYLVTDNVVRFQVKDYDPASTLVIDPNLIFCAMSGSRATNWGFTATYGPDGSFFGGGIVFGTGFLVSPGAFQTTFGGGSNSFDIGIIKMTPTGNNRVYATYIGGSRDDQPHSLIVDAQGQLIIAGRTNSPLPTENGAYPNKGGAMLGKGGGFDIIITKLNAAGTDIIGSRRIGGTKDDGVNIRPGRNGVQSLQRNYGDDGRSEVIIDGAGNIYVASCSQSEDFPTVGGFQTALGGVSNNFGQDAVVLKFNPDLTANLFATYLGGAGDDAAYVLSLAPNGNIYVAGGTASNNFPGNKAGTIGANPFGRIDGFVAVISNDGSTLIRSTYIGTDGDDQVYGIQFDQHGFPYIMGQTTGTWTAVNATYSNPGGKQFIAKLQPDLSAYVYSTMFGTGAANPNISPTAFLVDRCENVYVSGWGGAIVSNTGTTLYPSAGTIGLPVTPDASTIKATTDGADFYFFVLRKDAAGPGPLFASFFGQNGGWGDHVDGGTSRFDPNGVIYQGVCANCGGGAVFPTTTGVWPSGRTNGALPDGCNLGMIKIAFNLAGVGSNVSSAIGGVLNDTAGCFPLQVTFTDQIRNATEYIWNFGDGTGDFGPYRADTGYTRTHTFTSVGNYRVMLIAIDPASCNERDTSYINIRVGDLRANLAANYTKSGGCLTLDYVFNNISTTDISRPFTDTSFIWDFGDGSPRVIAGMNSMTHTFPAPGPYKVKLILKDTAYCNNPDSITLDINVATNVEAVITTPPVGCAPYTAAFTGSGGLTYQWDFGDPASGANNTSTLANPTHVYSAPGTYTIVMVASDPNTCNQTDVAQFTLTVYEKPTASFSYTPTAPVENTPNVFTNLSSANATRFKWVFGDGDTLSTTSRADVVHQYNTTGTFEACLIAYNEVGCSDTFCLPVETIINPALDVPNAFTPNSGDVNSVVMVKGFGISKMKFTIWNRWGQKVFETSNRLQGWDGKVNGVVQPMDVYAYTLEAEFFDGRKVSKKGDITLIR
jgi:gliding motility-associated-like protein